MMQLEEARREETNARHNFELLKQSLEDRMKVDNKELSQAKSGAHEAAETKASAAGNLAEAQTLLSDAEGVLKNMKSDCMSKANDHEASLKNREEELKVLAEAKKAIQEMTMGGAVIAYSEPPSLFQVSVSGGHSSSGQMLRTRADLANFEVVNLVRK